MFNMIINKIIVSDLILLDQIYKFSHFRDDLSEYVENRVESTPY